MSDDDPLDELEQLIRAEHGAVRVFWMTGATMQELVDNLALVLGEQMADSDDLHVTYNAMQNGWEQQPPVKPMIGKSREQPTRLFFEYSAFVVLRRRQAPGFGH